MHSKLAINKYYPSKPNSVPFTTEAKRATENARQLVIVETWNRIKQTNSSTKREGGTDRQPDNLDWDESTNHAHRLIQLAVCYEADQQEIYLLVNSAWPGNENMLCKPEDKPSSTPLYN